MARFPVHRISFRRRTLKRERIGIQFQPCQIRKQKSRTVGSKRPGSASDLVEMETGMESGRVESHLPGGRININSFINMKRCRHFLWLRRRKNEGAEARGCRAKRRKMTKGGAASWQGRTTILWRWTRRVAEGEASKQKQEGNPSIHPACEKNKGPEKKGGPSRRERSARVNGCTNGKGTR